MRTITLEKLERKLLPTGETVLKITGKVNTRQRFVEFRNAILNFCEVEDNSITFTGDSLEMVDKSGKNGLISKDLSTSKRKFSLTFNGGWSDCEEIITLLEDDYGETISIG